MTPNMHARTMDMMTEGLDHWNRRELVLVDIDMFALEITCRKTFVVTNAQKYKDCTDLKPKKK